MIATEATNLNTRQVVTRVFDSYRTGDANAFGRLLAENYAWNIETPATFTGPNSAHGKEGGIARFKQCFQKFEILDFELGSLLADGKQAAVSGSFVIRDKTTGFGAVVPICSLIVLNSEGQVRSIRDFLDSASMQIHLLGLN